MQSLLEKALYAHTLTHAEIIQLLSCEQTVPLFEAADQVRKQFVGDGVYLRGLIEFSSF